MKNKKKYLLVGLLLGIAAACIIIIVMQFRLRGSIKVVPGEDIAGVEAVFYRQDDAQWSADFLGDSQYTMGASGCLVTCIAVAMEMSATGVTVMADGRTDDLGWRKTPGELNQYLSQNSVYDSQGNLQWEQLRKLDYFQVDVYDTVSAELIQECLQEGRYPIVRVRMNGFGNFHYVLIIESSNGMFYCIDPLNPYNVPVPLTEYNNRVYAIRCVYPKYQKTEPETNQTAINEQEDD